MFLVQIIAFLSHDQYCDTLDIVGDTSSRMWEMNPTIEFIAQYVNGIWTLLGTFPLECEINPHYRVYSPICKWCLDIIEDTSTRMWEINPHYRVYSSICKWPLDIVGDTSTRMWKINPHYKGYSSICKWPLMH